MLATAEAKLIAVVVGFIIIGGILFGTYHYGRTVQKTKDDLVMEQLKNSLQAQVNEAQTANDTLKTQLGVQHEQANAALNVLLSAPAQRVRVPTCSQTGQANTAARSAVPATSTQRASDTAQSAFDGFRQGLESDAAEWSRALNACQVVMSWAKVQ